MNERKMTKRSWWLIIWPNILMCICVFSPLLFPAYRDKFHAFLAFGVAFAVMTAFYHGIFIERERQPEKYTSGEEASIDSLELSKEIATVLLVQKPSNQDSISYIVERVVYYHLLRNKTQRENCGWGCSELDEEESLGWYDGVFCPTCGYVRGMGKLENEQV